MTSFTLVKKLWYDSRTGHSTYLLFLLTFVNFILITYNYFIEQNTILQQFIPDLWLFSIVFIILYLPVSILIGRWYRFSQKRVDETIKYSSDPILAKMVRTLLDVQTGIATKEGVEDFRRFVSNIENDNNKKFRI